MSHLGLSITELHALLVSKKVTPLELAKEAIEACKNDTNNAFEYICEKEAIEFASSLKEPTDDLFWGIPYVAKDNLSTKDIPTSASSNILEGYVPLYDATVITKLKERGSVLIAKTTLDELAMGGSGKTGHLGKTFNPYDPTHQHMVGGSSCGSAASCAAGIIPFALGSDTGDSIRKPASHAGLVGFKPSWGRISRYGLFPFAPSMDHVGYFTRNVFDSALVLEAISGYDDNDVTSSLQKVEHYTDYVGKDIKGKKVAVIKGIVESISNKTIVETFNKTIEKLKENGAIINYVDVDEMLLKAIFPTYIIISCCEAGSNNANLDGIKFGKRYEGASYEEVVKKARTNGFGELIKRRFIIGSYSLLKENQEEIFLRAQKARRLIVDKVNEILKENDIIALPASPTSAPLFDASSDALTNEYLIADNHMAIGNFAGLPSLTLPIGFEGELPFGINLTGRVFEEGNVLSLASKIEEVTGYKNLYKKVN